MKKFFFKIARLGILFYVMLWFLQLIVDKGLRLSQDSTYYDWNKIYNGEINSDLVFFGSSRALKHFNPAIFDERMNIDSYNLGVNGAPFNIQRIKWNAYLSNNKLPKLIVINVDIGSLSTSNQFYNKSQYLPFFSIANFNYLNKIDKNVKFEYLIPMTKYRDNVEALKQSFKAWLGESYNNQKLFKGFNGSTQSWNGDFERQLARLGDNRLSFINFDIDKKFDSFETLLNELNLYKTPLLLVWSPEYEGRLNLESDVLEDCRTRYKELTVKYPNIRFIDFTQDSICQDKYYFYNSYHLNSIGASKFSHMLVDSIEKHYKDLKF